jgi:hypothetical protein
MTKHLLLIAALLVGSAAIAQKRPPQPKTIPDSINFIWKDIERDFTSLSEAMPEDKWGFKATRTNDYCSASPR